MEHDEIADFVGTLLDVSNVEDLIVEGVFDVGKALVGINEPKTRRGDI